MPIIEGHEPNPDLNYIVSFSGGKDSVATWLLLTRELKLPKVRCIFANTGHESPITYQYLETLEREHGLPLTRIQPVLEDFRGELKPEKMVSRLGLSAIEYLGEEVLDVNVLLRTMPVRDLWAEPLDMERLAVLKTRFPSSMVRFCTKNLKLRPMSRWMRENCDPAATILATGVRAQESASRAARLTYCQDELTGCMRWLPIHKWTHEQVFDLHKKHCIPPNPLYMKGCSRVGCWPCIMARKRELANIARNQPECFDHLVAMEERVERVVGKQRSSFFSNYKTPKRYHSMRDANGASYPTADDVRRWALNDEPASSGQSMMLQDDETEDAEMCTSMYGLCE